jgi:thiol-disulfide isomerase/thioredoxin
MKTGALLLAALLAMPSGAPAQDKRFDGANGWLNSPRPGAAELRGKVVLVNFWTYTCINWQRTLPYVRAWAEKYKDHGLVVMGAHTPEFEFEKEVDNVRRAVKEMRVTWTVAIDNEYAVWRAFGNNAWPAVYLVDAQGRIRYSHLREGAYERTEQMIQQLLAEAGAAGVPQGLVTVQGDGVEAPADWASLKSPETYLGDTSRHKRVRGPAARLSLNQWTLSGDWTSRRDAVALTKPNGRIAFRFHARDVNLVMGPATRGTAVHFRVLIDGKPAGAVHGTDVDDQGNGTVTEQRLFQLIRQPGPIIERTLEIQFLDRGIEAFAFTFG